MQKVNVSVNMTGGIDTKTDEKLVIPTKLTGLENGIFTKDKSIMKRPGYNKLTTSINTGGTIEHPQAIQAYKNELLLMANKKLFSYDTKNETYISKGTLPSCSVSVRQISNSVLNNSDPDGLVVNGIGVYAWHKRAATGNASLEVLVRNEETGTTLISQVLSTFGEYAKLVATGDSIHLLWVDNDVIIKDFIVNTGDWQATTTVTLFTNCQRPDGYAICPFDDNSFLIVYKRSNTDLILSYIRSNGEVGAPINGYPLPLVCTGMSASGYIPLDVRYSTLYTGGMIYVAAGNNAAGITLQRYSVVFTKPYADVILDPSGSAQTVTYNITSYPTATGMNYYYTLNITAEPEIWQGSLAYTAGAGSISRFYRGLTVAGQSFDINGTRYLPCLFISQLQATYFLIDQNANMIGKAIYQRAGSIRKSLPNSYTTDTGKYHFAGLQRQQVIYDNGTFFYLSATSIIDWNFSDDNIFSSVNINNLLFIGGSIPSIYDGKSVVESGFTLFPDNITFVSATTGGTIPTGTYTYQFTYEWSDNVGNIHRSSPSIPITINHATGSTNQVTFTIPTLKLTYKKDDRAPCWINIYRTDTNGTVLYRIQDAAGTGTVGHELFNQPNTAAITFVDTNANFSTSHELIYTTGGVLENDAPSGCRSVAVSKNRIFLVGLEDPMSYAYSKESRDQIGISFSSLFVRKIDPTGGNITAVASMDGKVILFKEQSMYAIDGDGPLDTGLQDTFTDPQLISTDVGCTNPNSIVLMPKGLMFKTSKGIYLLDRGLTTHYIGAPVEKYNDLTIVSADLLQSVNQVRFKTSDGVTLIYDYFFDQWGTFTNGIGLDAVIWNGAYTYLRTNGVVYVENPSKYKDDAQTYKLTIETAWLKLTGIQDYQRVSHAMVLGQFKSDHKLLMSVAYDYQPYYVSHHIFDASAVLSSSHYGDVSNYGDESPYGGDSDGIYQFRAHIERQKCESIRFKFEDQQIGAGQSYIINNLTLQIGQKQGAGKFLKSNKTI